MVEVRGSRGGQTRWKVGGRSSVVVGGARVEVGGSIGGSRRGKQGWKYEGVGRE